MATPIVAPVATPQAFLYPALAFGAPTGLSLAVLQGGVRMPAPLLVETPLPPPAPPVAPDVVQAPPPSPPAYVPPVLPRKQDRY